MDYTLTYEDEKERYTTGEQASVSHILLQLKPGSPQPLWLLALSGLWARRRSRRQV